MPVFNAAQNQVLISPVSSYYAGKAKRSALAGAELDQERKQQEIDMAPDKFDLDKRQVAAQERGVELREQELDQRAAAYLEEVGTKQAAKEANFQLGIADGAKSILDSGGTKEEAIAYANEKYKEFISTLPEGKARAELEKMNENGLQAEELAQLNGMAQRLLGIANSGNEDYTLSDGGMRFDANNNLVAENPKDGGGGDLSSSDTRLASKDIAYAVHARYGGTFAPDGSLTFLEKGQASKEGAVARLGEGIWRASGGAMGIQEAADTAFTLVEDGVISPDAIRGKQPMSDEEVTAAADELGVSVEDIKHTATAEGISIKEVIKRLRAK